MVGGRFGMATSGARSTRAPPDDIGADRHHIDRAVRGTAVAGLTVEWGEKAAKVWQKHAEKTKAYKLYKYVPKQGAPRRGRLVPNSGLTMADVTRAVQS